MRKPRRTATIAVMAVALAAAAAAFVQLQPASVRAVTRNADVPPVAGFPKAVGGKITGGPFSLIDHQGRPVSDTDFRGRFMLIYFGYTFCPDVCPTSLQVMSDAMTALGPAGRQVQPMFITFDPKRDSVEIMADYVSNFHARLLGLTGTPEQTTAAAGSFDVDVSATYAADDRTGLGYSMNHSAFTYLAGPDGRVRMMFRDGIGGKTMAAYIRKALDKARTLSGDLH